MRNPFKDITDRIVIFDGAMGTVLQEKGLRPGELPETWCVTRPDDVKSVHRAYLEAGADVITANTFGANVLKYPENGEFPLDLIVRSALALAREAADEQIEKTGARPYVALDLGPTGRMLKPLGDLDFEDALGIFSKTVRLGEKYGADFVLIETMNDVYELKAAVLAAKESSSLPIFASCVFDESSRLLTGADPLAVAAMLGGLRADAIGVNCGSGPDKMKDTVAELLEYSKAPVFVCPNAGMPTVSDGVTRYDIAPDRFADVMAEYANAGARAVGGCCGTTPEYIKVLCERLKDLAPAVPPVKKDLTVVTSGVRSTVFGKTPVIVGERINPTGKKKIKEALREERWDVIYEEAVKQEERGADVLDVNAGLPEIDEPSVIEKIVKGLQAVTALPLQIDTSDPVAMERALRVYCGKPLINSVNGKDETLDAIFPLAAKYGGVVVGLTLDESGIPDTAEGRLEIARKIVDTAREYGIDKSDIVIDPLVMAVSADPGAAEKTLAAAELIKKGLGVKISLGVSNVSFGLPERDRINSVFLAEALARGVDAVIVNPLSDLIAGTVRVHSALTGADPGFASYIAFADGAAGAASPQPEAKEDRGDLSAAVESGMSERAATLAAELLTRESGMSVIDNYIIPALDRVGKAFEEKKIYLPQLLMSAEAASAAFAEVRRSIPAGGGPSKGCAVLATVKGDIHDIGKNIVKALLENFGYKVVDLGRDVPPETVLEAARRSGTRLVGLSALMTTTVPAMEDTVKLIHAELPGVRVMAGGAVLTPEYAEMIGADRYCRDAMAAVQYAKEVYGNE